MKSNHFVKRIEVVKGESIKGYKGQDYLPETFLKIFTYIPPYISALRGIFERGFSFDSVNFEHLTYESAMPFALRYMIDSDIVGMGWI